MKSWNGPRSRDEEWLGRLLHPGHDGRGPPRRRRYSSAGQFDRPRRYHLSLSPHPPPHLNLFPPSPTPYPPSSHLAPLPLTIPVFAFFYLPHPRHTAPFPSQLLPVGSGGGWRPLLEARLPSISGLRGGVTGGRRGRLAVEGGSEPVRRAAVGFGWRRSWAMTRKPVRRGRRGPGQQAAPAREKAGLIRAGAAPTRGAGQAIQQT